MNLRRNRFGVFLGGGVRLLDGGRGAAIPT
jgi:hypothetical protein